MKQEAVVNNAARTEIRPRAPRKIAGVALALGLILGASGWSSKRPETSHVVVHNEARTEFGENLVSLRRSRLVRAREIEKGQREKVIEGSPAAKGVIALTFDDGPNPEFTPKILKILTRYNARATFFMIGARVETDADIAMEVLRQGHEIGSHTFSHARLTKLSPTQMDQEIDRCSTVIESRLGISPTLLRPPGGQWNATSSEITAAHGMSTVLWTDNSGDFESESVSQIVHATLSRAQAGGIILLHDSVDLTVQALPKILEGLKKKKLRAVTISELLGRANHQ
ncbi:MAG: polysaccharide deacetylase family protein [Armatimonadetes bacterium]|nr:polysaccharide deacetylase family protein [Armatimonadota bacterium]